MSSLERVGGERSHRTPADAIRKLQAWLAERFDRVVERPTLRFALLGGALLLVLATGVLGVGRSHAGLFGGGFDFDYLYFAGRLWLEARSPYDISAFQSLYPAAASFAYTPLIAPSCMLLAALPHDAAELSLQLGSLAATGFIAWGVTELAGPWQHAPRRKRARFLTLLVLLLCPFVSHVVWMGQTSLVCVALVVGAFVAHRGERYLLAGVLSACALSKPQLAMLPVLWLVAERKPAFLVGLALSSIVFVAWPVGVTGPKLLLAQYAESVTAYQASRFADLAHEHMFGLRSLALSFGVTLPTLAPLALALTALAYAKRKALRSSADVLALLLGVALLLLLAHDYDLVALAPFVVALYAHGARTPGLVVYSLLALALLYLPQRLLVPFHVPPLLRYRELVTIGLVLGLTSLNAASRAHPPSARAA